MLSPSNTLPPCIPPLPLLLVLSSPSSPLLQVDLAGCGFAEASEPAATPFNPNEPDGKYDLDMAVPAQRQVRGMGASQDASRGRCPDFRDCPPPPAFVPIVRQVALELQAIAAEQGLGCWVAASATLNSRRFKLAGTSKQLVRAGEALV